MRKQSAPPSQPRKITIRPFSVTPRLPENYEAETWAKLQASVRAIFSLQPVREGLEELYRGAEALCVHGGAATLYARLRTECEAHASALRASVLKQPPADDAAWLRLINSVWSQYCDHMLLVRSIFLYLDRTYALQDASIRSLWDTALALFRERVASEADVLRRTRAGALALVQRERSGDAVDRGLVAGACKMLSAVGLYDTELEPQLLAETRQFYAREAGEQAETVDVPDYLRHVEQRLGEEATRVDACLLPRSLKQVEDIVERELFDARLAQLLERGLATMLTQQRIEDLARMHALCVRVGKVQDLRKAFQEHVRLAARAVVMDAARDKTMVQELLDLRQRSEDIAHRAFEQSLAPFVEAVKDAFASTINERQNKPAELIAKFMDLQLRSGNKGGSEEEQERLIDRLVGLFRLVSGKDVFEAFYKKYLSKRLLLNKSASIDAERAVISKLKVECGPAFTQKLEGMFKDIDLSRDLLATFRQAHSSPSPIDMSVFVLTSSFWPVVQPIELTLPGELESLRARFQEFYLSKHGNRRLTWQHGLGTCVARVSFPKGRKEIILSAAQASIMSLFNGMDSMAVKDIGATTKLDSKELKTTLLSLTSPKNAVLTRSGTGINVGDAEVISFNQDYTSKLYRLKINSVQIKETTEENKKTQEGVLVDRQYQIDAAIVRVMKTRKVMAHAALIAELGNQLKFPVTATDLKKRIESLLEREYMERSEEDSTVYKYLA